MELEPAGCTATVGAFVVVTGVELESVVTAGEFVVVVVAASATRVGEAVGVASAVAVVVGVVVASVVAGAAEFAVASGVVGVVAGGASFFATSALPGATGAVESAGAAEPGAAVAPLPPAGTVSDGLAAGAGEADAGEEASVCGATAGAGVFAAVIDALRAGSEMGVKLLAEWVR